MDEEQQKEEMQIPQTLVANVVTGAALLLIMWRLKKMRNSLELLTSIATANNFQLQELEQSAIDARTLLELLGNTKGPQQ